MIEDDIAVQAAVVEGLRDRSAYPHPVDSIEVIETHISTVLLAGEYAYKLKKPVNLGFADFSTLERRRVCCEEEIRLNRRTAAALYLDVVRITRSLEGGMRIGGDGPAIEYAVRMRRFDADARLDQVAAAGRLDAGAIDRLAATIAVFHAQCERAPESSTHGTAAVVRDWVLRTTRQLQRLHAAHPLPGQSERIDGVVRWIETESARHAVLLDARRAGGFVRECHGDLHLANVALVDGVPLPFDCIEFDPALRFIDVISDVAFTWMDLLKHRLDPLAARFLNCYLEKSGDYEGLALLRCYAVYRALVRALVALIRRNQPDRTSPGQASDEQACVRYLELAERLTQPPPTLLVGVCGVSGSGKTTVARLLVERLGAVCIRSDIERKRLAGVAPTARTDHALGAGLYAPAATRATYARMTEVARAILAAGFIAIVDATLQRCSDRRSLAAAAEGSGGRFALVLCEAPVRTLQQRIAVRRARGDDASDASLPVLARQRVDFESLDAAEASGAWWLDTDTDLDTLAMRCAALAKSIIAYGLRLIQRNARCPQVYTIDSSP